jgi:phosphatidylglycerol:prolipoprotein diacylglycerol transferase
MWEYPGFDRIALQLGPLAIRWYGLMYLVGFVGGWWLLRRRMRQPGALLTPLQVDDLVFYTALGVIIGGRVGYMLFYGWDQLAENPLSLFTIWKGGMSFHGGFLGVVFAVALCARKHGLRFWNVIDAVAPVVPIGLGAGRIGNFINGELWGGPTTVPWGIQVPCKLDPSLCYEQLGLPVNAVLTPPLHPSPLYEAALEGPLLFALLWTFSARPRPAMAVSALFLIGYGSFRLLVEFVRLPDAHIGYLAFGWVTMGQVLTVPMILAGIVLMIIAYGRTQPVVSTHN